MATVDTRPKLSAQKRRPFVAEMYLSGKYQSEIARHFGVTHTTIHNDLKAIRKQWSKRYAETWNTVVSEQLAKIDKLEREAWVAWGRSQKDAETKETVVSRDKSTSIKMKKVGQVGEPQFLKTIQWCISERLKIVGGYASDKRADRRADNEERWVTEVVEALKNGSMNTDVVVELFPNKAYELIARAGIRV